MTEHRLLNGDRFEYVTISTVLMGHQGLQVLLNWKWKQMSSSHVEQFKSVSAAKRWWGRYYQSVKEGHAKPVWEEQEAL